jgi:hypothetical protein
MDLVYMLRGSTSREFFALIKKQEGIIKYKGGGRIIKTFGE